MNDSENENINQNKNTETDSSASLQSIIGSLLGNPAIMSMIGSLGSQNAAPGDNSGGANTESAQANQTSHAQNAVSEQPAEDGGDRSRPDFSGGLGKMFSNPEMLAKLPGMISAIMPLLGGVGGMSGGEQPAAAQTAANPAANPVQPDAATSAAAQSGQQGLTSSPLSFLQKRGKCCDKHLRMLQALKPYLNNERQQTVETIVKINKISEAFQTK